jgi:hypothetical protein
MSKTKKLAAGLSSSMLVVALAALCLAGPASAHTGIYARFNYCPSTNPSTFKCFQSLTSSGRVKLGKKVVPIVHPVTLQGGLTEQNLEGEEFISRVVAATNGETLSKTPQPVPGGLTGLVNCKTITVSWIRSSCEAVLENGFTGVNATLELAKPAGEIKVNENNLLFEEGIAFRLPVKVHLENPFLGSSCYVGSSSSPLMWNLTTGTTKPPTGTKALKGTVGVASFPEEERLLQLEGAELVDNTWSAPSASGCGGFLIEYLLNPIINASVGLPSAAGVNESVLTGRITVGTASDVNAH